MEKAKELLETTHMKVVTICNAVGYSNVSYFIQSFREYFGSSPENSGKRKIDMKSPIHLLKDLTFRKNHAVLFAG